MLQGGFFNVFAQQTNIFAQQTNVFEYYGGI